MKQSPARYPFVHAFGSIKSLYMGSERLVVVWCVQVAGSEVRFSAPVMYGNLEQALNPFLNYRDLNDLKFVIDLCKATI